MISALTILFASCSGGREAASHTSALLSSEIPSLKWAHSREDTSRS